MEKKLVSSCFNQGFNDGKRMFFLIPASFLFFSKTKKYLLLKHICLKYLWKWTVSQVFMESGLVFLATLNYFSENVIATHCVKSVPVRSFSGLYFTVFRLNSKIYKKKLSVFNPNPGKYRPEKLGLRSFLFVVPILKKPQAVDCI